MKRRPTPASYPAPSAERITERDVLHANDQAEARVTFSSPPRRLQISLPYPPSTNEWLRPGLINGHPRLLVTEKAKAYKAGVARTLVGRTPLEGPLVISKLHAYPPSNSFDLDNVFKVLLDALTGRGWVDDRQIKRITNVEMFRADRNPRVELLVEQLIREGDQLELG